MRRSHPPLSNPPLHNGAVHASTQHGVHLPPVPMWPGPICLRQPPLTVIRFYVPIVKTNAMPSNCPFKQYRCNVLLPFAHCVLKDLEKADRAMISYSNYELRYATRRSLSPVIENGDENPPLQDPTACG